MRFCDPIVVCSERSSNHSTASRFRTTGPTTTFAWHAAMAASSCYATSALRHITSNASALNRCRHASFLPSLCCRERSDSCLPTCRCLLVAGPARTIFAVSVRERVKIAATVSSGARPTSIFTRQLHVLCASVESGSLPISFADARCARAHFAKTANPTTCLSCQSTTAVSPRGY